MLRRNDAQNKFGHTVLFRSRVHAPFSFLVLELDTLSPPRSTQAPIHTVEFLGQRRTTAVPLRVATRSGKVIRCGEFIHGKKMGLRTRIFACTYYGAPILVRSALCAVLHTTRVAATGGTMKDLVLLSCVLFSVVSPVSSLLPVGRFTAGTSALQLGTHKHVSSHNRRCYQQRPQPLRYSEMQMSRGKSCEDWRR